MTTITEARHIALLLHTWFELIEWWDEGIAAGNTDDTKPAKNRFVIFADVSVCADEDGHGTRSGWNGEIILPRGVVSVMFEAAKAYVKAELAKLGVEVGQVTEETA